MSASCYKWAHWKLVWYLFFYYQTALHIASRVPNFEMIKFLYNKFHYDLNISDLNCVCFLFFGHHSTMQLKKDHIRLLIFLLKMVLIHLSQQMIIIQILGLLQLNVNLQILQSFCHHINISSKNVLIKKIASQIFYAIENLN